MAPIGQVFRENNPSGAAAFAKLAAKEFGIGEPQTVKFEPDLAKKDIAGEGDVKQTRKGKAKAAAEPKPE